MDNISHEKLLEISKELLNMRSQFNLHINIEIDDLFYYENGLKRSTKLYVTLKHENSNTNEKFYKCIERFRPYIFLNNNDKRSLVFPQLKWIKNIRNIKTDECISLKLMNNIYFIHFWALWNGVSVDMLELLNNYSLKHIRYGKVKFITINLDDNYEAVKEFLNEAKYDYLDNYLLNDGWDNGIIKTYNIIGLPEYMLINVNGSILDKNYDYKNEYLFKKIEDAIEKYNQNKCKIKNLSNLINTDERNTLIKDIENITNYKNLIDHMNQFELKLSIIQNIKKEADLSNYQASLIIKIFGNSTYQDEISNLGNIISNFTNNLNKNINIKVNFSIKQIWNPKIESICGNCQIDLKESNAKYLCIICHNNEKENYTYCINCVLDAESEDISNPFHEHFLIYFPPNSHNMTNKMNNLMQKFEFDKNRKDKYMRKYCNNCRESINVFNFMCTVCNTDALGMPDTYDLCNLCFKISQDPNRRIYKDFDKTSIKHDNKSHPMMRYNYKQKISPIEQIKLLINI